MPKYQPGDRVIVIKDNDSFFKSWGIHIGDIGTVTKSYVNYDDDTAWIKFDRPLSRRTTDGTNTLAPSGFKIEHYNEIIHQICHRAKLAERLGYLDLG